MTNKFLRLIALLAPVMFASSVTAQMVSRADAKRLIIESIQRTGKTVNVGMQMQTSQLGQYVQFNYSEDSFRKVPLPKQVYQSLPFDSINLYELGVSGDESRRVFAALVHAGVIEGKLLEVRAGSVNAYRYSIVEIKKGLLQRRDNEVLIPIYQLDDVEITEVAVAGTGLSRVKYALKLGAAPSRQTLLDEGFRFFSNSPRESEFRQTDRGWKLDREVELTWPSSKLASAPANIGQWEYVESRSCWLHRPIGSNLSARLDVRSVSWSGNCRDGLADGKGSIVMNGMMGVSLSGDVEYVNGKLNGSANLMWPTGDKFQGQYKDGVIHGMGTFTKPNGQTTSGEYRNGVLIRKL